MKIKVLITIFAIGMIISVYAQNPTMTLTFTADSNGQYVPLNSIFIDNLTQGGDTTLYAPDTMLVLDYITGIGNNGAVRDNGFSISQNYPNPIEGKTTISIYLPETENILIVISDIMGKELIYREWQLDRGNHSFKFLPGSESLYFLTARTDYQSRTIKMLNPPTHAFISGICKLEYNGQQTGFDEYKSGNNLNNFVFDLGDQLKFTASTNLGERIITSAPNGDQTFYFHYTGEPCQGTPTVTDIDNNTYNTVQIGSQCWMKENLKTTTYRNGAPIPNVIDDNAWSNLSTGAYIWLDNDISWKDKYGALYNWFATVDPNNLCPTGWHIPDHDEWIALTDYIGGTGSPHGNELKSCRQDKSPLGVGCNTTVHPRWEEDPIYGNFGTDDYGFSGLPGGYRHTNGNFYYLGYGGGWWSSVEYSSSHALGCGLHFGNGNVGLGTNYKQRGFSIRCLRD